MFSLVSSCSFLKDSKHIGKGARRSKLSASCQHRTFVPRIKLVMFCGSRAFGSACNFPRPSMSVNPPDLHTASYLTHLMYCTATLNMSCWTAGGRNTVPLCKHNRCTRASVHPTVSQVNEQVAPDGEGNGGGALKAKWCWMCTVLFFPTPSVELTVRQSMRMGSLTSKSIASISKVMERQSLGIGETGLEEWNNCH